MKDTENVRMEISIAGEHISLSVPFDRQDMVRDTEKSVAHLYDAWRRKFPGRTNSEVLAMVAYQFASYYNELRRQQEDASVMTAECIGSAESILDSLP